MVCLPFYSQFISVNYHLISVVTSYQLSLHISCHFISVITSYQLLLHISCHFISVVISHQLSLHISYHFTSVNCHFISVITSYQLLLHISCHFMSVVTSYQLSLPVAGSSNNDITPFPYFHVDFLLVSSFHFYIVRCLYVFAVDMLHSNKPPTPLPISLLKIPPLLKT